MKTATRIRVALFVAVAAAGWSSAVSVQAATTVGNRSHEGWADAIWLDNGTVEAVVVPSIGRVMQFRFKGGENVLWENPLMLGGKMPEKPWETPGSFGGDKTWPAPQSKWNWPPPDVFDASPLKSEIAGDAVILRSPVSARYGIETERKIRLDPVKAAMVIETTYIKRSGEPVEAGVWVISQTAEPEAAFLPVPANSKFAKGLTLEWGDPGKMPEVKVSGDLASIKRIKESPRKIGNDAASIIWVGKKTVLRIDAPRILGADYPDDGCSAEIYTNNDPAKYVELETVGPVKKLAVGDRLSATNTYTLFHRGAGDAAKAALEALR